VLDEKKRERGNLIISIDSPRFLLSGFELYFIVQQQQQQQRVVDYTFLFCFSLGCWTFGPI
jgi:hypothetical protein